ncbi:glycosyltransferase family 4 protein [Rhodonellum sp.]|uniref:glycosyltransferase family 4 protein n=1 Tax=Rhodonellum sp. TaxID=2231180 RepID=UPI002719BC6A|nr:glycosyltransferase family 4 protein [Rhodonellum sp.]MDO9551116.1 glycosyltransferase family 4 protein [Rhodonellum sp.]
MNILHINDKVEISGGVEVNINNIIKYLEIEKISNYWIGIYNNGNYFLKFNFDNKVIFTQTLAKTIDFINKIIIKEKIDIIHIHSISDPGIVSEIVKLAPVVKSMRDPRMFCPGQGKFWRKSELVCNIPFGIHCLFHAYSQGCMNRHPKRVVNSMRNTAAEIVFSKNNYKAIIVMSKYMFDESLKVGIPENKLILNPHLTEIVEESLINILDLSRSKRIVFIGRLSKTKGVHYFIKVGLEVLKTHKAVIFDIIGDGHDRALFEKMIPDNLKNNFHFAGWKSPKDISEILQRGYMMIFPSIYPEAFGISGIEAMMHGKPVVGFDVGGVSTWLKNDETGYLVKVKDIKSMTEKVKILLDDSDLYLKMSKEARRTAIKEFSPEIHIKKLLEIYNKALEV